jgi:DNA-binding IclR family transcriptional regulator
LAVLTAFSFNDPVLGVSELGRRVNLPKSTVHRLLGILVHEGFVERTPDDRYRLSLKLYEIGQEVVSTRVLRQVGHVPLEKLHNDTGEATHLAVLSGTDVVYLDRLESPHMMGVFTKIGRRRAAHATSSGKVLLAFGSQADLDEVVKAGLPRLGPRTITTRTRLNQALAEVRKVGYALSTDESAPGVVSIAAPIFDREGACVAAVSVAGTLIRMPSEQHPKLVRMVVKTAAEISKALVSDRGVNR